MSCRIVVTKAQVIFKTLCNVPPILSNICILSFDKSSSVSWAETSPTSGQDKEQKEEEEAKLIHVNSTQFASLVSINMLR
jgi:hypothetical protein